LGFIKPWQTKKMFPKKIHLTCKNKKSFEEMPCFKECLEKYKEMYSDYTITVYYDDDIYELIRTLYPHDYDFMRTVSGVVLADTFRYLILYVEGGIYSDLDCNPVKRVDFLNNDSYFHGDCKRSNHFYIYPNEKHLLNARWDFYENPCDNCTLVKSGDVTTYKCLGHMYINKNTNVVLCKENFKHTNEHSPLHNDSRLCQWFMMATSNQEIFLDCYKQCVSNLKKTYEQIVATRAKDRQKHFGLVLEATGPILITNVVNKSLPNDQICILPPDFFCCGSGSSKLKFVPFTKNCYVRHKFCCSWNPVPVS